MIRVLIADDIQILRKGLEAILSQDPEIEVVGLAANGHEAYRQCCRLKPDVVLMDMRMPEYDGAYGIRRIKAELPGIRVLVLTTFDDRETVDTAIQSGADGYILKEMEDEKVIRSVKAVCAGIQVFGESVFAGMRQQIRESGSRFGEAVRNREAAFHSAAASSPLADSLTPRELDVIRCVVSGMDNKEIAASLFLAEGTVRNNISRLLEKLQLKDRTQLAVFAIKNNLE